MKPLTKLPGKIVAMSAGEDALYVVYRRPWWLTWLGRYGVRRYAGERIA